MAVIALPNPHLKSGGLSASVVEGITESVTVSYLVEGLTYTGQDIYQQVFTAANLPLPGQWMPGDTNLKVIKHDISIMVEDRTKAYVTVHYGTVGESITEAVFTCSTRLESTTTQKDRYGTRIVVAHTFPEDDADEEYAGKSYWQGGDVQVQIPKTILTATGRLQIDYPDIITTYYTGCYNSTVWAGRPAYTWMCTRVDAKPADVGYGKLRYWYFTFEFELDLTTWIPTVFYTDPRTGKPPDGLVEGLGIKQVDWYGFADFNEIFPLA